MNYLKIFLIIGIAALGAAEQPLLHLAFENNSLTGSSLKAAAVMLPDQNAFKQQKNGACGSAAEFDGINAVEIKNAIFDFSKGFTMEFFLKRPPSKPGFIISFDFDIFIQAIGNKIRIGHKLVSEKPVSTIAKNTGEFDKWTHVALSYNPEKDENIRIFFNGTEAEYEEKPALSFKGIAVAPLSKNIFIAKRNDGYNYTGSLDEIKIYNTGIYSANFEIKLPSDEASAGKEEKTSKIKTDSKINTKIW